MEFFRRITVAIADPADSELFRYTQMLAGIAPALTEFRFVHVMGRGPQLLGSSTVAVPPSVRGARRFDVQTHRATLESLRRSVEAHLRSTVPWHCDVRRGDRIDQVLHAVAEWESDLLVIGHRRASSGRRSMARRLAMKAPCSLWMVPEGSARPIRRVFAAVDFSGASAHALTVATRVASRARASACLALHVRAPGTFAGDANVDAIAKASDEQAFRRFLGPIDLHQVPIDVRTIESSAIATTIERIAREEGADLVVAGTRGRTPSATILLGSESEQLLSELPSPLLVTRPRGERPGLLEALLDQAFTTAAQPRVG